MKHVSFLLGVGIGVAGTVVAIQLPAEPHLLKKGKKT